MVLFFSTLLSIIFNPKKEGENAKRIKKSTERIPALQKSW